jgi:sortase A
MMYFTAGGGREVMYKVTETLIVNPEDIWITYETGKSIATLFACHPKGSARHRIVVRAALVGDGKIF